MPELYTFGDGTKGQLGHAGGKKVNSKSPARVDTSVDTPMHGLSCGHFHALAVSQDGSVYSWGSGVMGLLGHGTEEDGSMPRRVEGLGSAGAVAKVACGPFQSAAVTEQGELYVFGWAALPAPPQRPEDEESSSSTPPQMPSTFHTKPNLVKTLPQGLRVAGVACGCYAIAAWSTSGKLLTWGKGGGGQLGHGGVRDEAVPRVVQGVELEQVVEAAFGGAAKPEAGVLLVRSSRGTLHSCGCAAHGRLGRPLGEPADWGTVPLPPDETVVGVAAGDHHACAVSARRATNPSPSGPPPSSPEANSWPIPDPNPSPNPNPNPILKRPAPTPTSHPCKCPTPAPHPCPTPLPRTPAPASHSAGDARGHSLRVGLQRGAPARPGGGGFIARHRATHAHAAGRAGAGLGLGLGLGLGAPCLPPCAAPLHRLRTALGTASAPPSHRLGPLRRWWRPRAAPTPLWRSRRTGVSTS